MLRVTIAKVLLIVVAIPIILLLTVTNSIATLQNPFRVFMFIMEETGINELFSVKNRF